MTRNVNIIAQDPVDSIFLLVFCRPTMQVAFYSYFLEQIFKAEIDAGTLQMSPVGGVWLQPAEAVKDGPLAPSMEEFQLKPWLQLLGQHLLHDIPAALSAPIEDVPWHLNDSCGSCPYLADCGTPKAYGVDIRTLPNVSKADSKFLQKLSVEYSDGPTATASQRQAKYGALTLQKALVAGQASDAPGQARALRILGASPSSAAAGDFDSLTSVLEDRPTLKCNLCGLFPATAEGIAVYITLHCDPALDLPYAYGVAVSVNGTPSDSQHVATVACDLSKDSNALRSAEYALLLSFVTLLCDIVDAHSASNAACKLSFYVWEGLEKYCLSQLIIKSLCGEFGALPGSLKQRVHYLALVVLDYPEQWDLLAPAPPMQGDLGASSNAGTICNSSPRVCDVTLSYKALLHLPIPGFYAPASIYGCIATNSACASTTEASATVSLDHIERVWTTPGDIAQLVRTRLQALITATTFLRSFVVAHDRTLLFNISPPLPDRTQLRAPLPAASPLVERLLFMKEVDVLVRCSTARQKRISALNNTNNNATALVRLRCVSVRATRCTFEQLSGPPVFCDNPASVHIKKWCLTTDRSDLVAGFVDIQYLVEKSCCKNLSYRFVTVVRASMAQNNGIAVRTVEIDIWLAEKIIKENNTYVMFERGVDLNIKKSLDSLAQAAQGAIPLTFEAVLQDPNTWNSEHQRAELPPTFADLALNVLDQSRMDVNTVYRTVIDHTGLDASPFAKVAPLTGVQARAFQMLLSDRLTIVWGPPGTTL